MDGTHEYKGYRIDIIQDDYYDGNEGDDIFIIANHRDVYVTKEGFNPVDVYEHSKPTYKGYHALPLYAYIHSGVSLSLTPFSCVWDSCQVGYVMVKREKGWSWRHDKAFVFAQSFSKSYNDVIEGNVWGYRIYKGDEEFDSCWGYVGDSELALQDAMQLINKFLITPAPSYS